METVFSAIEKYLKEDAPKSPPPKDNYKINF